MLLATVSEVWLYVKLQNAERANTVAWESLQWAAFAVTDTKTIIWTTLEGLNILSASPNIHKDTVCETAHDLDVMDLASRQDEAFVSGKLGFHYAQPARDKQLPTSKALMARRNLIRV